MKTTPDGLTHLINMLVDVVNLQRKAQATPNACCEVELTLDEEERRVAVHLFSEVYLDASSTTLSADNNRPLTAEEQALEDAGFERPAAGLR
jgi:hypothetical protein